MSELKDYLQIFDATPEQEKFPLVYGWMQTQALDFFKQLRERRPILVTPDATIITLFEDVRDMLMLPKIFTVALYKPKMADYLMAHDDDALHDREKAIMHAMLNRDDLPLVRELVAKNASRILDDAKGQIEIVENYCRGVPASIVQDYFGLDGVDPKDLKRWSFWTQYNTFHNQPFSLNSKEKYEHIEKQHAKASDELGKYIIGLMIRKTLSVKLGEAKNKFFFVWNCIVKAYYWITARKVDKLTDNIVTRMLSASYPQQLDFGIERQGVNAGGLLIGAIETTSQAVAQSIEMILSDRLLLDKAEEAAQKKDTSDFDNIVWETLRYVPISPFVFRQAAKQYTVAKGRPHETTIEAGAHVIIATQSAMFDTYAYENPDEFSPDRTFYHNFIFGYGSHECLGKYVGMVMIPEMVRQVILRRNIKAEGKIDYDDKPFPTFFNLSWE
ncbi:MAG: cytochrome P450 [Gammaproteobacteria bacterium]|nr:cytochrome P450 [Gammaproteobacteria bacterium]